MLLGLTSLQKECSISNNLEVKHSYGYFSANAFSKFQTSDIELNYTNLHPLLNNVLEIKSQEKSYDLHSDSDFYGLIYCKSQANVKLIWNYPSIWFRNESIFKNDRKYLETHNIKKYDQKIELSFEEVEIFEVSSSVTDLLNNNEDILEDIRNYYENNDGEIKDDGSIVFVFQSEMQIRIKCNSIHFLIDKFSSAA